MSLEVILALAVGLYIAYLHLAMAGQQRKLAELEKAMLVIPLPKKSNTAWLRLLTLSVVLLTCAVLYLALR